MSRRSRIFCALVPALTLACQANVSLTDSATNTEASASDGDSGKDDDGGGTFDTKTTGDCVDGTEGCPCYGNETCNDKLVCNAKNLCEQPAVDTTGVTTVDTTGGTTGDTTGAEIGDTTGTGDTTGNSGNTTEDTTESTTGKTSDTTTGGTADTTAGDSADDTTGDSTTDSTTGGSDPDCGNPPPGMACVPANTFEMGTSLNTYQGWPIDAWERPGHMVTISKAYWIDKTEVTVEDYAVCWALKVCELPMQGPNLNWGVAGKEKHPANGVNWYQAKKYCEWKGKRLPTEAEWELAARGVDGRLYPWGDAKPTCEYMVSNSCGTTGTQPVGSKPLGVSPYGLLDMAGNVAEWCSDYYKEDFYYQSPAVDPKGPMDGTKRSARSLGVFVYMPSTGLERATYRAGWSPLANDVNPAVTGFRCAQTVP